MGKNNDTSAGQAAQVSSGNQTAMLQQIQQLIGKQQSTFDPATSGLGGDLTALSGGAGAGTNGIVQLFQMLASNPQLMESLTGINASGQNAKGLSFFNSEMNNGLDPATKTNANSQLQQQFQQSQSDMLSHLKPGQNASAIEQAGQNKLLESSVNLNNNLASQDQAVKSAGATAGVGLANEVNQQAFQNVGAGGQLSLSALAPLLQLLGISTNDISALSGNASQQGNQALQYSGQQQQINNANANVLPSVFGGLLGAGGAAMTGGAAGAGGLGGILKAL